MLPLLVHKKLPKQVLVDVLTTLNVASFIMRLSVDGILSKSGKFPDTRGKYPTKAVRTTVEETHLQSSIPQKEDKIGKVL